MNKQLFLPSGVERRGRRSVGIALASTLALILAGGFNHPAAEAQAQPKPGNYADIEALLAERQFQEALTKLQARRNDEITDSNFYLLLAQAYLETGAGIAAEAAIERARRLGADYAGTAVLFAKSLLVQGKYADALGATRGVTIPKEAMTLANIVIGDANFALKNYPEARRAYELARSEDETNFQAYLGLARLAMRDGNLLLAEDLANKALTYGPQNTMVHYTGGLISRYLGKRDLAEQRFLEAIRLFPGNIMANIEMASVRIDQGDLTEAEKYLDAIYAVTPNYPMALYLSGVILASRGQYIEANAMLNRARGITDNYLPATYVRGLVAYQVGNYAIAEAHLSKVLGARPNNQTTRMALAGTYMHQNRPSDAFRMLQPLLEVGQPEPSVIAMAAAASMAAGQPERGHALYELLASGEAETPEQVVNNLSSKLALARFVAGNTEAAYDAILKNPRADEVDLRELGVLAGMQFSANDLVGAETTIKKILDGYPDRALGYNMRGTLEYSRADYQAALNSFSVAIQKNPEYFTAIRNRALAEMALGQFSQAEKDLKKLLSSQPTDIRAKAMLGRTLLHQKKGEEAISYFAEAIRAMPNSADLLADNAEALAQAGKTSQAIEQARETAVVGENRPDLLKRMGVLLLDLGQAKIAVRPLSRLVAFDPDNGSAHLLHGRSLLSLGLHTGAKISFERAGKASENQPSKAEVDWYIFTADAYSRKYDLASRRLPSLDISKRPSDVRPSIIGDLLVNLGRLEEAIKAYETALVTAETSDVAVGLAKVLEQEGRRQTAIQTLEDYVKKHPTDRAARMALGGLFERSGLPGAATEQYEAILRGGIADAHIVASLARAYLRLGNKKSIPLAERAYLIAPDDPFILDIYGWIMLQAKRDTSLAEEAISKATRRAPSEALYRFHLGMTYLAQGRRREALQTLKQAVSLNPNFEGVEDALRQISLLE